MLPWHGYLRQTSRNLHRITDFIRPIDPDIIEIASPVWRRSIDGGATWSVSRILKDRADTILDVSRNPGVLVRNADPYAQWLFVEAGLATNAPSASRLDHILASPNPSWWKMKDSGECLIAPPSPKMCGAIEGAEWSFGRGAASECLPPLRRSHPPPPGTGGCCPAR